jgi:hypothetical protein
MPPSRRASRALGPAAVVALAVAVAGPRAAAEAPAEDGERRAVARAGWLLDNGRAKEAIALIKAQRQAFPGSRALELLLGAAYLGDGNEFWAIRVLARRVETEPHDCEARVLLAWARFRSAMLEEAAADLDHDSCRGDGPLGARASLVRAMVAGARGHDASARSELARARAARSTFQEDREALDALSDRVEPDRLREIGWQADVRRGYTTNALLGSPIDPSASSRSAASSFLQSSTWLRLTPFSGASVRPSVELQLRVFHLFDRDVRAQSYVSPTGRAGVYLGDRLPRALLAYRQEYLRMSGGDRYDDGPLWYVAAHRGEVELEATRWLLVFAGAGRRSFRPLVRGRVEVDGGFGGQSRIADGLAVLWAVSARRHVTETRFYDLVGSTALGNLQYTFGLGWQARAGLTLGADWYPDSAGYFADERRRDLFLKAGAAFWSPAWRGLRSGVTYDYSDRASTAPLYAFTDQRVAMIVSWSGVADFAGPSLVPERPVAAIPWGLGRGQKAPQDRIQELLRQDEQTLQRSCGCKE